MVKIFGKIIGLNFIFKDLLIEQLMYVVNIEPIVIALDDYTPEEVEELLLYAQNYLQEEYPNDFDLRYQDIKTKMIRYLKRKYNLSPVALVIWNY